MKNVGKTIGIIYQNITKSADIGYSI